MWSKTQAECSPQVSAATKLEPLPVVSGTGSGTQKIVLAGGISGTEGIVHTGIGPLEALLGEVKNQALAQILPSAPATMLECGCGTGQLTNFLSIANRTVIGTDLCINSLKLATAFKEQNALPRAHFLQMNLFRPAFKPGSFDLVISNGVLHHTPEPQEGLSALARCVRPGGSPSSSRRAW